MIVASLVLGGYWNVCGRQEINPVEFLGSAVLGALEFCVELALFGALFA